MKVIIFEVEVEDEIFESDDLMQEIADHIIEETPNAFRVESMGIAKD